MQSLNDYCLAQETLPRFVGQYTWIADPRFGNSDGGSYIRWSILGDKYPSGALKKGIDLRQNPAGAYLRALAQPYRAKYPQGVTLRWVDDPQSSVLPRFSVAYYGDLDPATGSHWHEVE